MPIKACISASLALLVAGGALAAEGVLPTYAASYRGSYKGHYLANAEFSVRYDAAKDLYTFESRTTPRGLLKLIRPGAAVERSDFVLHDGAIRPREYWFDPGGRDDEDDLHIVFDWAAGVARVEREQGTTEVPITPGVLDRASMQVAVMRDMRNGGPIGPYTLIDEDSLSTYEYAGDGREQVETGLGDIATQRYLQTSAGSSRSLVVFAAPELEYLPVLIEQQRRGETETSFLLESLDGLEDGAGD
jgi:Protein of unknown function (DUF3108)